MKKNGFSLVELLAVVVILAIIISIAGYSVFRVRDNSLEKLLNTKIDNLIDSAKLYGQENWQEKQSELSSCTIDGVASYCLDVTVYDLIDKGYYTSSEVNSDGEKDLINNVTGKSMLCDTFTIYKKNNRIYAREKDIYSNNDSFTCGK